MCAACNDCSLVGSAERDRQLSYELHVTVAWGNQVDFSVTDFFRHCEQIGVKPLFLIDEIPDANVITRVRHSLMTKSSYSGDDAFTELKRVSLDLRKLGYEIARKKIETVPWHPEAQGVAGPHNYFESHISIDIDQCRQERYEIVNYLQASGMHVSYNKDKRNVLMSTFRRSGVTANEFQAKASEQIRHLSENFAVKGPTITEYTLYDSNQEYDSIWVDPIPIQP